MGAERAPFFCLGELLGFDDTNVVGLTEGRDAIILEKKEDMKKRGLASPNLADALALTFAYPVAAHDHRWQLTGKPRHQYQYDPFHQAWSGRL